MVVMMHSKGVHVSEGVPVAKKGAEHFEGVDMSKSSVVRTAEAGAKGMLICRLTMPTEIPLEAVLAVSVKCRSFVGVHQNFIGLGNFFESLLSTGILVFVGVVLQSHSFVGLFDVLFAGLSVHSEDFVIIFPHFIVHIT